MKICSLSKSMEWLIQLQLTAPYSKELPDYPTKHCKPILSVVSVTSISLILLQKVIPRHKKWRRLPALPEVSIWINTAVGSQEIRLFLEAASCSQGTLTSTRGRCRLHPTQPQPYTSAWHFIVSVSKNRRDKQLMPLSFHWMHLSVTAATLQRMPGQRALALLALLKILARSCGHRSFWFTRFLRKCTGSQELPLCLQFAGTLPNLFCFQKELKQVLCLCKAA